MALAQPRMGHLHLSLFKHTQQIVKAVISRLSLPLPIKVSFRNKYKNFLSPRQEDRRAVSETKPTQTPLCSQLLSSVESWAALARNLLNVVFLVPVPVTQRKALRTPRASCNLKGPCIQGSIRHGTLKNLCMTASQVHGT